VTSVLAANLTVNGSAATSVSGSGAGPYVFSGFSAPADGTVNVAIAGAGITDSFGNTFAGDSWTYTKDGTAPTVTVVSPAKGASITSLPSISVTFSEPVLSLFASNLTVNGSAATSVTGSGAGPYTFSGFAAPSAGSVTVNLFSIDIHDAQGNPFAGDTWSYTMAASNPPVLQSAVSRKVHGSAGTFDINLPLTAPYGIECRQGGPTTLVLTFDKAMSSTGYTLNFSSGSGTASVSGNQLTITMSGAANAQTLTVQVLNLSGTDGSGPANYSVSADVLLGAVMANRSVASADIARTKSYSGSDTDGTNFRCDVTVDGTIGSGDIAQVKSRSGDSLP